MRLLLLPVLLLVPAFGCSDAPAPPDSEKGASPTLPESFWATETAEGALDVLALREEDLAGRTVTVRGTVKDFVEGLSAFVLVEDSFLSCDERPGDTCKTPWDYCCTDPEELARGTTFVEFREGDEPGAWAVEGFHGIERLSEVFVSGTLAIDDADNLRLVATSIGLQ
ncbi:MAG: hypothetical protein AAF726_16920 [Planctomycetota bacterium]